MKKPQKKAAKAAKKTVKPAKRGVKAAPKKPAAKRTTRWPAVRATVAEALGVPPVEVKPVSLPPPAPPVPAPQAPAPAPAKQGWRANIDWVAAGKKAHETRLRNAALKAAGGPTPAPPIKVLGRIPDRPALTPPPPRPTIVAKGTPKATAPKEDLSRPSRSATRSRTTGR